MMALYGAMEVRPLSVLVNGHPLGCNVAMSDLDPAGGLESGLYGR